MALSVFFTDYLDRLLNIASFDEESKKKLKAELVEAWTERSGQRVLEILTPEEIEKISSAFSETALSPGQNPPDKLTEAVKLLVSDKEKQEKVITIYSEEAEKILGEVTDTFVQNTDLVKQQELANALADLEAGSSASLT